MNASRGPLRGKLEHERQQARLANASVNRSTRAANGLRLADVTKPPTKPKQSKARAIARAAALRQEADDLEREALGPGRPTDYKAEFGRRATAMCLLGLTNEELAARFEVDVRRIELWIETVPEFARSVWDGREGADEAVAGALWQAAKGYSHEEDDIRTIALGDNKGSEIVITKTIKHYPPHDGAIGRWMRARQSQRFPNPNADAPGGGQTPEDKAQIARAAIRAALATTSNPDDDNEGGN